MVDQKIVDFIKKMVKDGISLNTIKSQLKERGWPENEINDAIQSAVPSERPVSKTSKTPEETLKEILPGLKEEKESELTDDMPDYIKQLPFSSKLTLLGVILCAISLFMKWVSIIPKGKAFNSPYSLGVILNSIYFRGIGLGNYVLMISESDIRNIFLAIGITILISLCFSLLWVLLKKSYTFSFLHSMILSGFVSYILFKIPDYEKLSNEIGIQFNIGIFLMVIGLLFALFGSLRGIYITKNKKQFVIYLILGLIMFWIMFALCILKWWVYV